MVRDEAISFLKMTGRWDEVRGQTLSIVAERVRPEHPLLSESPSHSEQ